MQFFAKTGAADKQSTQCLILGLFDNSRLSSSSNAMNQECLAHIGNIIKKGDINGAGGETLMLYDVPGIKAPRLLLLGLGKSEEVGADALDSAVEKAIAQLNFGAIQNATLLLPDEIASSDAVYAAVRSLAIAAERASYHFDQCKSKPDKDHKPLKKLTVLLNKRQPLSTVKKALAHGKAIADGQKLCKNLANLPGNICTPSYLAKQATKLGRRSDKLKVSALTEKQMEKLGMGALLSVSRGSRQPARLIVMEYQGAAAKHKPVVLVGKGLTFDAGGISIKPSASMDEMKYDMCGGASVFGVIQACIDLELPINVVGIVPSSENLPDGEANKPGDIVTSMAGLTIEILNTDAEGRLILCDALTYAKRFKPAAVIDIATLTGACVVALGHHISGLLANDDDLAKELESAGQSAQDPVWRLPMNADYHKQLQSNFADLANIGGKGAGTITAACFLSRFSEDYCWAHLDIAGTAWKSGHDKGATGRPVALLTHLLLQRCKLAE